MYYALILLSVVMFGSCFAMNDAYRKMRGNSLKISMQCTVISSIPTFFILLAINAFRLEFTPYTLLMAIVLAVNSVLLSFCSFQALGKINLSLYSLFMMLGGMLLPFLQGIIFYGEQITVAKCVCFVAIFAALFLTLRKGERKSGTLFYVGVFVLNGMSGVISKLYTDSNFEKASPTGLSLLSIIVKVVIAAVILLILYKQKTPKHTPLSVLIASGNGVINQIANLLLLVALVHVDASVQYPMVTGGTMIVSTAIAFLDKSKKPSRKDVISGALAFIGTLALFVIPV